MKSFHRNMGYITGIFIIMIVASLAVSGSYMQRNDISIKDLFEGSTHIQFDDDFGFKLDSIFNDIEKSSHFDTKVIEQTDTFKVSKELFISSSIENIVFLQEDRNDIQVDYYREMPNSTYYNVNYSAKETDDKITVSAAMSVRNLTINHDYKGTITIHVPMEYTFDKLTLDSGISTLKDSNVYLNTKDLTIISSLGDVNLSIAQPLEVLHITSNLGSVKLKIDSDIDKLTVNCDMGKINLTIDAPVNVLTLEENLGDINITSNAPIEFAKVNNNMGKLDGNFNSTVNGIDFYTNMGSIEVTLNQDKEFSVYAKTSLGKISTDYPKVKKDQTNFHFVSNMGSIIIE